jgi:hypothetical protein
MRPFGDSFPDVERPRPAMLLRSPAERRRREARQRVERDLLCIGCGFCAGCGLIILAVFS